MNAVMKVASYGDYSGDVTEMPYLPQNQQSLFSSNDDDAERTGALMLSVPVAKPELKGSVTYPMWRFRVAHVPLSVKVSHEDDVWIASIDDVDVFGDGETQQEALATLEEHLLNYIEFFRDQRAVDLTDYAKQRRAQFLKIRVTR